MSDSETERETDLEVKDGSQIVAAVEHGFPLLWGKFNNHSIKTLLDSNMVSLIILPIKDYFIVIVLYK